MKNLILLVICLAYMGCINPRKNHRDHIEVGEHVDSNQIKDKVSIFKSEILSDTFDRFVSEYYVPNPYDAPKINFIDIFLNKKDTIILFSTGIALPTYMDKNSKTILKGASNINDNLIVVHYSRFTNLDHIINEELLSVDYAYHIDTGNWYKGVNYNWTFISPEWEYKYSGDKLYLIKKTGNDKYKVKQLPSTKTGI